MSISRAVRSALAVVLVCALCAIVALVRPASAGSISSARAAAPTSEVAGTVTTRMVINRFRAVGRRVVGRGTVVSTFRNAAGVKSVKRKHFWLRIREARSQQQQLLQQQQLCHILFLEIGEVDLTLAGLHAILRSAEPGVPIQLRLQADREHGILGRLFCDLAEAGGTVATPAKAKRAARTLTRRLKGHTIMRVQATIYAPSHRVGASAGTSSAPQGVQQEAECEVLHLVLGPVHLDLLGLVVDLNKIILDLKAIPGTLLGNIFCQLVTPPPPAPAGP